MRYLPLGIFLLCVGFFMMGASTALITDPTSVGRGLPILGAVLAGAGFLVCRPALTLAKSEIRALKAPPRQ